MEKAKEKVAWCDRDSSPLYQLAGESKLRAEVAALSRHTKKR
jgi:hypothetical protein